MHGLPGKQNATRYTAALISHLSPAAPVVSTKTSMSESATIAKLRVCWRPRHFTITAWLNLATRLVCRGVRAADDVCTSGKSAIAHECDCNQHSVFD